MSGYLLDVNVLIALSWRTHVHHVPARRWFDNKSGSGWATCPITQLGFVRVSSNPGVVPDAVSPREAVAVLTRLMKLPGHRFWPDEVAVSPTGPFASLALVGHRQVTDAYLLALAQQKGGKVATLDRGVAELVSERHERTRWVEVIPPGE